MRNTLICGTVPGRTDQFHRGPRHPGDAIAIVLDPGDLELRAGVQIVVLGDLRQSPLLGVGRGQYLCGTRPLSGGPLIEKGDRHLPLEQMEIGQGGHELVTRRP